MRATLTPGAAIALFGAVLTLGPAEAAAQTSSGTAAAQAAQPATPQAVDVGDLIRILRGKPAPADQGSAADRRKAMRAIAPVIGYKPSTGVTFGVAGNVAFYRGDLETTHVSSVVTSLTFSSKKQTALFARFGMFTGDDRWFVEGDNRFLWTSQDTYGLGTSTVPEDRVNMRYDYFRVHETFYRRLVDHFYVGAGFHFGADTNVRPGTDADAVWESSPYFVYSEAHGFDPAAQRSVGLSLNALADLRDNAINPGKGWRAGASYRMYIDGFLGGTSTWQELRIDARTYRAIKADPRRKLALWFFGDFVVNGVAPYLDLPATGTDLYGRSGRGYAEGRFRGERLVYGEVEYRTALTANQLVGLVVFLNTTTVTNLQGGERLFDTFATGGGAGLRLLLNKRSMTNLCFDVGVGQHGSHGVYLGVQEAF
ncbi:MAG: BamA/TamA family outer membrane protein [Vicinamibacterales bacterium]